MDARERAYAGNPAWVPAFAGMSGYCTDSALSAALCNTDACYTFRLGPGSHRAPRRREHDAL